MLKTMPLISNPRPGYKTNFAVCLILFQYTNLTTGLTSGGFVGSSLRRLKAAFSSFSFGAFHIL